ncbi:FHA domain-containing protein [Niabella sp. W65]|nr:FHA domain-containing protein [Niabella sp. W65]MCH7364946.1 FHA domain-containing protein [Niabella sp. W65]
MAGAAGKKCLEKRPQDRFKTGRELSQFYYDGIEGKIEIPQAKDPEPNVIDIDPLSSAATVTTGAYLEVVSNFLTQPQRYLLQNDVTVVGRWNEGSPLQVADFAIRTGDKFISKNHCQIIKNNFLTGAWYTSWAMRRPAKMAPIIMPKEIRSG